VTRFSSKQAMVRFEGALLEAWQQLAALFEQAPISERPWLKASRRRAPRPAESTDLRERAKTALARTLSNLLMMLEEVPLPEHAWLKADNSSLRAPARSMASNGAAARRRQTP